MAKTKKKNKGAGGTKKKAKVAKRSFNKPSGVGSDPSMNVKENPFEIRVNRSKHDNLGRRARHEKGVPGVSRSKAIEKRRDTLLKEYKIRNKSSIFVDKRIGEKIKNMSEEEKIIRRSVVEKQRQYKQKSIFNLPSTDDILTHKGQLLMDVDRYEDPRDGSDSEDERLNEEFVSDAHFAGDFLKVKSKSADDVDEDEGKSRGDIIAELILNSKKRKMEKAKEADENYELVTKLDQEFKNPDFRSLLTFMKKDSTETKEAPPKKEDYDKIVRELHFETKTGLASNRLKTEEEIQDEELQKLKKLEKERIRRMQAQDPTVPVHKSADDLADDFEDNDEVPTLSYGDDGQLNKLGDEEEDDEDEDDSSEEDEEQDDNEEESEDDDAYSDLESDDNDELSVDNKSKVSKRKKSSLVSQSGVEISENDDIPFTISLPKSYANFIKLLTKYQELIKNSEKCVIRYRAVVERLVKYSLLADKSRLPDLFVYILRLIIDGIETTMCTSDNIQKIVYVSIVNLHTILLTNSSKCVEMMEKEIIQRCFDTPESAKSNRLTLSKIAFYRICSKLFGVTDFCHRVLSPMKVDVLNMINACNINSYTDLLKVLEISDIMFDMSKESKRYSPEIVKLLVDIMEAVSLPIESLRLKRRRFEFLKVNGLETDSSTWVDDRFALVETSNEATSCAQVKSLLLKVFELANNTIQALHRTKAFNNLIFLVMKAEHRVLHMNWKDKNFVEVLFCAKLSSDSLSAQGNNVDDELPSASIDRPKMLKLYEIMIEEDFDGNRKRKQKRKGLSQEESRLSHKVKKEMKSAAREILKDNAFLAKQQLKEQASKDAERSRKVLLGPARKPLKSRRRLQEIKKALMIYLTD